METGAWKSPTGNFQLEMVLRFDKRESSNLLESTARSRSSSKFHFQMQLR